MLATESIPFEKFGLDVRSGVTFLVGLHAIVGVGFLYCIVYEPGELVLIVNTLVYAAALLGGYFVYRRGTEGGW